MPDDGYFHAMDRGYIPGPFTGFFSNHMSRDPNTAGPMFEGLSPKVIGISAPPMKDQLSSLKSRIFQGASKVELGFWGRGKGSLGGGNTTPEMYGKDERIAMRELALVNEIEISTHVAPNVYGWAGLHQGKFSDDQREENIREVRRTIEFAKDVSRGGAVVIHTGEFPRSLAEKWGHQGFRFYPEEAQKAEHLLVNSRTGEIIHSVKENQKVWIPEWEYDKETGEPQVFKRPDGSVLLDEMGNPVKRLALDDATKEVKLREVTFSQYVKEEMEKAGKEGREVTKDDLVKQFYKEQMSVEVDRAIGQAKYFGESYHRGIEMRDKYIKEIERYKRLQETMGKEQFEEYIHGQLREKFGGAVKSSDDLFKVYDDQIKEAERQIQHGRESLTSGKRQAAQIKDAIANMETLEEYGVKRTAESIARMGMMVYDVTQEESAKDPHYRPMFIAPENIYPEQYGAHPQELKRLILDSRQEMAKMLQNKGYDEEEAKKLASQHIRATFDIGHVNTWWKYFTGSREEFKNWILKEVDDLNKHDIIGHLHIADNFGYEDEHTTPGQGTSPIKEFVEKMAAAGITDMVTEPAHQDFKVMLAGWEMFGGPVYGRSVPGIGNDRWTNIHNSYFGKVDTPHFIVGDYSPSQDFRGSPFFSGVPFE